MPDVSGYVKGAPKWGEFAKAVVPKCLILLVSAEGIEPSTY